MDLEKQTRIIPPSTNSVDQPTDVSLFDAVRKWTDAEGMDDDRHPKRGIKSEPPCRLKYGRKSLTVSSIGA